MKTNNSTLNKPVVLVAFGASGEVRDSNQILDRLLSKGVWYCRRPSAKLQSGSVILFYQNGRGFVGYAEISEIEATSESDAAVLDGLGLEQFQVKLCLSGIQRFKSPVNARDIKDHLTFVTNKEYWGHGFRTTPRLISTEDFALVKRLAGSI